MSKNCLCTCQIWMWDNCRILTTSDSVTPLHTLVKNKPNICQKRRKNTVDFTMAGSYDSHWRCRVAHPIAQCSPATTVQCNYHTEMLGAGSHERLRTTLRGNGNKCGRHNFRHCSSILQAKCHVCSDAENSTPAAEIDRRMMITVQ